MSVMISIAALAFSLSVFLHSRWRDKRDLLLRILDELLTAEKQSGRRILYRMVESERQVEDLSPDERLQVANSLAALDLLGIYYRRRYVRRRDVLDLCAVPLARVLPAAKEFLAYRDAQLGTEVWPHMRTLCRDAQRHIRRRGLTVRVPSPPDSPVQRIGRS